MPPFETSPFDKASNFSKASIKFFLPFFLQENKSASYSNWYCILPGIIQISNPIIAPTKPIDAIFSNSLPN